MSYTNIFLCNILGESVPVNKTPIDISELAGDMGDPKIVVRRTINEINDINNEINIYDKYPNAVISSGTKVKGVTIFFKTIFLYFSFLIVAYKYNS
jgi:hypothetical protein